MDLFLGPETSGPIVSVEQIADAVERKPLFRCEIQVGFDATAATPGGVIVPGADGDAAVELVIGVGRQSHSGVAQRVRTRKVLLATIAGACAALVLGADGPHQVGLDAPTLRAALVGVLAIGGSCGALLFFLRFSMTEELRSLVLAAAMATLTLAVVVAYTVPATLGTRDGGLLAAAGAWGVLFAAAAFAVASGLPSGRLAPARTGLLLAVCASLAALLVAFILGALFGFGPTRGGAGGSYVIDGGSGAATLLAVGSAAIFAVAAAACWHRARPGSADRPLAWGLGAVGAAQYCHATIAVVDPGRVGAPEVLNLIGFALLATVAFRCESEARRAAVRVAVIAERQRVARDLHDGIAQDLAFIAAHSASFDDAEIGEHPLATAARRALAVSRGVISDLSDLDARPLSEALAVIAAETSERFSMSVRIEVCGDVDPPARVRSDLLRIVREAIANAARHGSAERVTVSIDHSATGIVLRIRDDGRGILGGDGRRVTEGFGLGSMRDRALALGGRLTVSQHPRGGTEVVVMVP